MNRLASQKSPYLLQHADNPVDWFPWGKEALETARRENKPIFLSIGYSTCHWCHVMERESFSDPTVAALMNQVFVSIKVDREERPDLDEHFMLVSRLLTGTGGWPLTVLLTPEARAFYSATYIPRENAYGRMGMLEFVPRIRELWTTRTQEVTRSAEAITAELGKINRIVEPGFSPACETSVDAAKALALQYDRRYGGFGSAPKFPMPTLISLLLRAWKRSGDPETLDMVEHTLTAMRGGGIYDQVGFGFHRYSTDPIWLVPHFEKMLYDQALHCLAYTEAWQATGREAWRQTALEICGYVLRDLATPEGGFATAEDADSEGSEGRFYLWTREELAQVLGERLDSFLLRYSLDQDILHRASSDLAPPGEEETLLLAARAQRPRPYRDDKILADWNGLMIAALARAGAAFGNASLVRSAESAAQFVMTRMRGPEGRLLHRYRDGESAIHGFADDYAFLSWGLLELYEATLQPTWLRECIALMEELLARFWDPREGGFFSTENDEFGRKKSFTDGVIPSANSVAASVLQGLNRLTGRTDFQVNAERLFRLYPSASPSEAVSFSFLLAAADFAAGPSFEVVIAGEPAAEDTRAMREALRTGFHPRATVLLRPPDPEGQAVVEMAPYVAAFAPLGGKAAAYVCRQFTCSLPTADPAAMLKMLE